MTTINLDADLRSVYKRLAMKDRIEVFATPSNSRAVYCSKCDATTYPGQLACCPFMVDMLAKYFNGGNECTSLSCT